MRRPCNYNKLCWGRQVSKHTSNSLHCANSVCRWVRVQHVSGLGFRCDASGSGFKCDVSGSGFRCYASVLGFRCDASGLGFRYVFQRYSS